MKQQKLDSDLNAGVNTSGTLRRLGADVVEDQAEGGDGPTGVAEFHKACFAHTARTWSSVANSPRAAAACEVAIAARSSGESAAGGASSVPARRRTTRAMSSCVAGGRLRAASSVVEGLDGTAPPSGVRSGDLGSWRAGVSC